MKKYIYEEPEKHSYEDFIRSEVPEYSNMEHEDLLRVVQIYSQSSYYVNSNWET